MPSLAATAHGRAAQKGLKVAPASRASSYNYLYHVCEVWRGSGDPNISALPRFAIKKPRPLRAVGPEQEPL